MSLISVQIEAELLSVLPAWEEANGRPFMVQGYRVVDRIQDAIDAKEAAKEAKKVCMVLIWGDKSCECLLIVCSVSNKVSGLDLQWHCSPRAQSSDQHRPLRLDPTLLRLCGSEKRQRRRLSLDMELVPNGKKRVSPQAQCRVPSKRPAGYPTERPKPIPTPAVSLGYETVILRAVLLLRAHFRGPVFGRCRTHPQ